MINKIRWSIALLLALSLILPAWKSYAIDLSTLKNTKEYTFGYGYSLSLGGWLFFYLFPLLSIVFQSFFKIKGKWLYIIEILLCLIAIPFYYSLTHFLFSEIWIGGWVVLFLIFSYLTVSIINLKANITSVSSGLG